MTGANIAGVVGLTLIVVLLLVIPWMFINWAESPDAPHLPDPGLRDDFAAFALQGQIAAGTFERGVNEHEGDVESSVMAVAESIANVSYRIADEMLKARDA